MGAPPFIYPKEAGLPLGGPNANKYVMLEVHYNNPELKKGKVCLNHSIILFLCYIPTIIMVYFKLL